MSEMVPYLIVFGCLVSVVGFFTWLKGVVRRRGLAGTAVTGALASYEEAMRTTAHDSHVEVRAQADRRAPILSPDDPRWTGRTAPSRTRRARPLRRWRLHRRLSR
ncbi:MULTISPECIES: hypothetical protein [unclassified Streptomyces]|uniref:hypothetical protein n=1 Tax=unclassified Streptomyces TaxID=2593676 RepID=UPI002DDA1777|nr:MULTISPECIES: hypothetical protein [unclassified Streptomyces]WSB74398.1 hypothetical protein OHB04_00450 [Streptomyces sp. NBC_01775]WSS17220.1 hypothetical protein OG533_38945 [Streptomyces sp. NBC_01186]WSS45964.1 hypothetical protein OG220_39195 [Streptomyces sp. NBC_01187]